MTFEPPRPATARWRPVGSDGLEHLTVSVEGDEIVARGVVIGGRDAPPYGVDYTIVCDANFRTRELHLGSTTGMALSLLSDGAGRWRNHDGRLLPEFDGCLDVDLAGSPFTNTLPIRRIEWEARGRDPLRLPVLFVPFDTFAPVRDEQSYAGLEPRRFRFESGDGTFGADLAVDPDGLVLDYPGLFRRVPG